MTAKKKPDQRRGAVLQMEIDVPRFTGVSNQDFAKFPNYGNAETAWDRLYYIIRTAASDTIRNGGTLVLVCDDKTITIVQRPKETIEDKPA